MDSHHKADPLRVNKTKGGLNYRALYKKKEKREENNIYINL